MKQFDTLQGSLDLLVLKILSRRPAWHGYAIMTAIKETSGEVLNAEEGSLYPALHRMEEAGWIRAEWVTKENGRRARIYRLTAAGKKQLAAEEVRWRAVPSRRNTAGHSWCGRKKSIRWRWGRSCAGKWRRPERASG
jgi:transcriptional regulator